MNVEIGNNVGSMQMDYSDTRLYVIPPDQETRDDLLSIDRRTKEMLRMRHHIYANSDWECNTVANVVIETLLKVLYSHIRQSGVNILSDDADNTVNFYDLIEIAASNKKSESAEKSGNINVKFTPGKKVEGIISDNVPDDQKTIDYVNAADAYSYQDDLALTNAMRKIDHFARKSLKDKYSILFGKDFHAIAIAYVFIENLYRHMVTKIVQLDKSSVMINFNDLIEFHAIRKKENSVEIRLRPGMGAKLIIKSDESTESDDDDGLDE